MGVFDLAKMAGKGGRGELLEFWAEPTGNCFLGLTPVSSNRCFLGLAVGSAGNRKRFWESNHPDKSSLLKLSAGGGEQL